VTSPGHHAHAWRGIGYVLGAAVLFAVNGTVSKTLLTSVLSSVQWVQARCVLAALVLAGIALLRDRGSLRIGRRELVAVAAYGTVGVALVQWLYFVAVARMPISVTLLIEFTAPLLIALWVKFVRRDAVHSRVWVALLMILTGLALVARVWDGLTLNGLALVASMCSAVCLASYYLLGEHLLDTGTRQRDPYSLTAWSFMVAALFWSVVNPIWTLPVDRLGEVLTLGVTGTAVPAWVLVGYGVLLGTVAPFGLTLLAVREIGAARTGLLATAEPPLAGLVAWPVLGETLSPVQLVGGAVVLTGIVLAETSRTTSRPVSPLPPETLTG
jgi:drug/metabolite transporter (DMT)-like permease